MSRPPRDQPGYWAFLAHRLSGLGLALFLPLHFLALGTALDGPAGLDVVLGWTANPLVKLAEWGLVVMLALHLGLGLRVLALEFLPWRSARNGLIGAAAGFALAAGAVFGWAVLT